MDAIYVILVDGYPRMKDNAIRTYKTRVRAEKEAQVLIGYGKRGFSSWIGRRIETAQFGAIDIAEVIV